MFVLLANIGCWFICRYRSGVGHLTDSHGRRVDFRNTVIIMTSNLGAQAIAAAAVSST